MKKILLIFVLVQVVVHHSQSQDIAVKGVVLDSLTKEPVVYVNIGFPNQGLGTVSKEKGVFTLSAPDAYHGQNLVFSHVGYIKKDVSWEELKKLDTIFLKQKEVVLGEVLVKAKKTKVKRMGIVTHSPLLYGTTQNEKGDIVELAQKINASDKEVLLKNANIYLQSVYGDSAVVRINFYKATEEGPGEHLIHQQFLEKRIIKEGWQTFNLSEYNLLLNEDFYVSFEFLPLPDKLVQVTTGAKLFRGD